MRRSALIAGVAVGALVAGMVGWAAAVLFSDPGDPIQAADHLEATARRGSVEQSLTVVVTAAWPRTMSIANAASGVVTSVAAKHGGLVDDGSVLYTVDLRPVVAAAGRVPSFRPIGPGVQGEDVAQLQRMLKHLGFYDGAINGQADASTTMATEAWQSVLGLPGSGRVEPGDIAYFPHLPARASINSKTVQVGALLHGGEPAIEVLGQYPSFSLSISSEQNALIPDGSVVRIAGPNGQNWRALVATRTASVSDSVLIRLQPASGRQAVCGAGCEAVPVLRQSLLTARIVVVPRTSGVVVPSAALTSSADGQTVVTLSDTEQIPVTVVASAGGRTVVAGLDAGERIHISDTAQ
jgi:peptidoglycan hydrolase-like protein with peptidoglycan-binding domain